MNYEITKVGIPIREIDVTNKFLQLVQELKTSTDSVAVLTNDYIGDLTTNFDYISSLAGHKILFDNFKIQKCNGTLKFNILNTYGDLWKIKRDNVSREPNAITDALLAFLDTQHKILNFKQVYIFSPGSPFVLDMFTSFIPKRRALNVIDARSSIYISADAMSERLQNDKVSIRSYIDDFINKKYQGLRAGINVFGGVSNKYDHNTGVPMITHFFQELRKLLDSDDVFMYTSINNKDVDLTVLTFKEAQDQIDYFSNTDKVLTFGVAKKNNTI
jgi:hypothetical protein